MVREMYQAKKQSLRDKVFELLGRIDNLLKDREKNNQGLDNKIRDFIEDVKIYA
jgi:hypothetical protein